MNEPQNDPQITPRPVDADEAREDLRRLVNLLFGGLLITSFTLTAYLGLQLKRASAELFVINPRAEEAGKVLQQDNANAEVVTSKLTEFGRTHPDFQARILSKYKFGTGKPAATPGK